MRLRAKRAVWVCVGMALVLLVAAFATAPAYPSELKNLAAGDALSFRVDEVGDEPMAIWDCESKKDIVEMEALAGKTLSENRGWRLTDGAEHLAERIYRKGSWTISVGYFGEDSERVLKNLHPATMMCYRPATLVDRVHAWVASYMDALRGR